MRIAARTRLLTAAGVGLVWMAASEARAQRLDENCTATIQNRTVQVNPDGTFAIPNVPADRGFYRVRVVCRNPDGTTAGGQTSFLVLVANGLTQVQDIIFGAVDPIPTALRIAASHTSLQTRGETVQLEVTGVMPDGNFKDLTARALGTTYATSNPRIVTVGDDGLVTAMARGRAIVSARNEGVLSSITIDVLIPNDADGDTMTDEYERANGLNINDATDAGLDPDQDGLTNLQEFQRGTNPRSADTDGDGIPDGEEIKRGTDPLRADTDGDELSDGQELIRHTNPLNPDTDGDGLSDGLEVELGLNPLVADAATGVQGRVVDEQGAPVAGAAAVAFNVFTATTDLTGVFTLGRVPVTLGPIAVLARAIRAGVVVDGTSLAVTPVTGGVTDVGTIQIGSNAGTVTGLVTDPLNRPVAGALVSLTAGNDVRTTVSDATGRYRVQNMVTGTLTAVARDPRTGLRGRNTGTLALSAATVIDVRLGPSATVVGMVFDRNEQPVGGGVTVTLTGATFATTRTDPAGRYSFDFVPLGAVTIDASDASNRGRSTGNLTATSQVLVADVTYLAQGTVTGTVTDGGGNPVANASVTLSSRSIFGGLFAVTTDGTGRYQVSNVFLGGFDVFARSSVLRTAGRGAGTVAHNGEVVTVDIGLTASGSITGTVFHNGGTVPAAGVRVSASPGGFTATTDSSGRYRMDLVPVGSYTLDATEPTTGDRGRRGASVNTQDEVVTADITLNGQGRVVVTVRDGGDALVAGAQVTVTSQTVFGGSQSGTTQADGTLTFERVLAGPFEVRAVEPPTQLAGSTNDSVGVGATRPVTVRLQGAGSIKGTVFAPDGTTPMANVTVRAFGQVGRSTTTSALGTFRFDVMPTSTYSLDAVDGAGSVRARETGLVLATHGQVLTRDLTLVGVGMVRGRVTMPDGTAARSIGVQVVSRNPGFGRGFSTQTDVNGDYQVGGVPVGMVVASASGQGVEGQLFGQASGVLAADGAVATVNVRLAATNLYDASNFAFFLRESGSIRDGTGQFFAGDSNQNRGAAVLDLVVGGSAMRFGGDLGLSEESGRELSFVQSGLGGLDVTRKVYVPPMGYFARYLEVLTNPTADPITADVRLTSHFRFIRKVQGGFTFDREPRVISTSSGDDVLDVLDPGNRDRWAVVDDDDDGDPFLVNTLPAVSHVFDGEGGAQSAARASFSLDVPRRFGRLVEEWQGITVPPGESVALLHFVAQQTSRAAAQASAERLAMLPPEALVGLSAAERAEVRNFAVPAGDSAVDPLPALTGSVTGRVLAGDGTTPVPGSPLTYRSRHPLFGRTFTMGSDGTGTFRLNSSFNTSGTSVAIPQAPFQLQAVHSLTLVTSPLTLGDFVPGVTIANQDVVFTNTGQAAGTVRRFNQAVVSSGTVDASGEALLGTARAGIATAGTYRMTGLPGGDYLFAASVPHPQGTALAGVTAGAVANGATTTADITIGPTGVVIGFVRRAGGEAVPFLPVQLRGAGGLSRVATTDTGGRFQLTDLPTGTVTLETFDGATNTAASITAVVAEDQTTSVELRLSVGGTVAGIVRLPGGAPAANAQVAVSATNGTFNTTTGADGRYQVDHVAPGPVVALATHGPTGLRGRSSSNLGLSGQTLTLDVDLFASGSVSGQVFRAGTTTAVVGAQVSIDRYLSGLPTSVQTDAAGHYAFDFVPLGSFTIDASDTATGDRGRATNQINANGESRVVNVTLNGVGRVVVTVRDASGNLVSGAQVTLTSQTIFDGSQSGTTQGDGTVTFDRVLAGGFFVSAVDPLTQLAGSTTGTVAGGGSTAVTVSLEPAGTILGRVLNPDDTVAAGVTVRLNAFFGTVRQATSGVDGRFRFDAVRLGTYSLDAVQNGRIRARESNLSVGANGDVITRDLHLVGLGVVSGLVRNPGGAPAPLVPVTLRSSNAVIGGFFSAITDAAGRYQIEAVPVGNFVVSASSAGSLGETSGHVDHDGEQVTADIQLLANAVTLPVNRFDANDFFYDVQPDGSIANGTNSVYRGDFSANQGAFRLDLITGGVPHAFTGAGVGSTEDGGREIVVRQLNLAGLDVTRKVFVPREGYLVRYLEILSNPTADPITVDVRVTNNIRSFFSFFGPPRVIATSSGDTLLGVANPATADNWATVDDGTDGDPFQVFTMTPVAFAFDGPGAAERAGTASFATLTSNSGRLSYGWNGVTVAPGATVAYMHFGVQQTSRAAAQASAERLVQLPPEALAGLGPQEGPLIRNFAVPADGTSPVPPLPSLRGTVAGRTLAGDGSTAVPFASVRFRSRNLLFGRTWFTTSAADGTFGFVGTLSSSNDFSGSRPLPVDGFVLQGTHPTTGVSSGDVLGSFPIGQTAAARDVVFANTGLVRGTVRRHTGTLVNGGSVQVDSFNSVPIASDGTYLVTGVPPGLFAVTAFVNVPGGGTQLRGQTTTTVVAGQTTTTDVTIEATGSLTGTVFTATGATAVNLPVDLFRSGFFRSTVTNATTGVYRFDDVPTGSFTVRAFEPATGVPTNVPVQIVADQTTTQDLVLVGVGSLAVQVNFAGGSPAPNSVVHLFEAARGFFRFAGVTDDLGRLAIANVASGAFTVRAFHPANGSLFRDQTGTMPTPGQLGVPVTVTLPAVAPVRVTVLRAGAAFQGAQVFIRDSVFTFFRFVGTTNIQGQIDIAGVPEGVFTVRATDPATGASLDGSGTVVTDGQLVPITIDFPNNAINLPVNRWDANNFSFDIQANASVSTGMNSIYRGDFGQNQGAFLLDVVAGGVPNRFTGQTLGTTEEDGREIVVRQQNLAGLTVTRKVFVPRTGYMARYLEVLENPTADPITVDLRLTSNVRSFCCASPQVIATSSGDAILDVSNPATADRWVVIDDFSDGDPFLVSTMPALAFAFDGPGAAERVGTASFTTPSFFVGQLSHQWTGVTVPAGGTVAFMHFGVQQTSRSAAQASAARLVQLPPEALAGLTSVEAEQIRNFAVPVDLSSSLAPLPALTGTVTGRTLAGDAATAVPFTSIRFKSDNVFFGRTHFFSSDANGSFTRASSFNDFGGSVAVPVDGFTLQATHPITGVPATAAGSFPAGQNTATRDVVFNDTGIVAGMVRRHTGDLVTSGSVQIFRNNPFLNASVSIGADGRYVLTGIPAGDFTLTASIFFRFPDSALTGTRSVSVVAGQTTPADITIEPTGTVTGTVRTATGDPASGVFVRLRNDSSSVFRQTSTNDAGQYTVFDVPVGTFFVEAFEPSTSIPTRASVTVVQDQTTTQDLRLIGLGTVQLQVNRASGAPAEGGQVNILEAARGSFRFAGFTSAGVLTIRNVAVGDFTVRAFHPSNGNAFRDGMGTVASHGDVVSVSLTLPAVATVRVTVQQAGGAPLAFANVEIRDAVLNFFRFVGRTNASGVLDVFGVPEGAFTVLAREPGTFRIAGTASGTITAVDDGQIVPVLITPPFSGTVEGTVFAADGLTPVPFARVQLFDVATGKFLNAMSADANGFYRFTDVRAGNDGFRIRAFSPDFTTTAERTGAFTSQGQTVVLDVTLPISVVSGTVTFSDGTTPVPFPDAFVTQVDGSGNTRTFFASANDAAGGYRVFGVAVGAFTVTAQDPQSGLRGTADGTIVDITAPVTVNVTLQASGTVEGTVRDAGGAAVPLADVALSSSGLPFDRFTTADAQGFYRFEKVALGVFTVQARDSATGLSGIAVNAVTNDGQTVVIDVVLPATGTVEGTVLQSDGATPVPAASVTLENFAGGGPLGAFSTSVTTDGVGHYTAAGVPEGTVQVTATDPASNQVGTAEGQLVAPGPATIDVTLGNATRFLYNLVGTDTFRYDVNCDGDLNNGGTTDGALNDAYDGAYRLQVDGASFPCFSTGRLEDGGREVRIGTWPRSGLTVSRKVFVPAAGGFARYLEVLENTTATDRTVTVEIASNLGSDGNTRVVVPPSATSNTFAVTDQRGFCCDPALAHVFSNTTAPVRPAAVQFLNNNDNVFYRFSVTVPAGQTRIVMHFAVQRPIADTAGAQAQAQALVDLSEPNALVGMSADERAQVVNFALP